MTDAVLGPYRLDGVLRRDGLGEVRRAVDVRAPGEVVALRLLPEHLCGDTDYRARFAREASIATVFDEPHVVPLLQYGDIDGRLYLTTPLVAGTDLGAVAAHVGPMAAEHAVMIVEQVAAALDAMHLAGLAHREISPATILLTPTQPTRVQVLDAGLARDATVPMAGPEYASPERWQGSAVDRRADVYALACVFFQLLTGRPPYGGELGSAHRTAPVPFLAEHRPELAEAFDPVVARGLAKDPARRHRTAGELARAARAALGSATAARDVAPARAAPVGFAVPLTEPIDHPSHTGAAPPAAHPELGPAAAAARPPVAVPTVARLPRPSPAAVGGRPRTLTPSTLRRLVIAVAVVGGLGIGGAVALLVANRVAEPPAEVVPDVAAPPAEVGPRVAEPPIDRITLQTRLLTPADIGPGFVAGEFTPAPSDAKLPCGQPTLAARFTFEQVGVAFDDGAGNQAVENVRLFTDAASAERAFGALREGFACGQGRSVDGRLGTIAPTTDVTSRVGGDEAASWNLTFPGGSRTAIVVARFGEVLLSWQAATEPGAVPGAAPDALAVSATAVAKILQDR